VLDFLKKEFPKASNKIGFGSKEKSSGWKRSWKESALPSEEMGDRRGIGIKPISYLAPSDWPTARSDTRQGTSAERGGLRDKGNIMEIH